MVIDFEVYHLVIFSSNFNPFGLKFTEFLSTAYICKQNFSEKWKTSKFLYLSVTAKFQECLEVAKIKTSIFSWLLVVAGMAKYMYEIFGIYGKILV